MKQSNEWLKCFHENQQGLYFEHTLAHSREELPSTLHVRRHGQRKTKKEERKTRIYCTYGQVEQPQHFGAERIPLVSLHRVTYTIMHFILI